MVSDMGVNGMGKHVHFPLETIAAIAVGFTKKMISIKICFNSGGNGLGICRVLSDAKL